MAPKHLSAVLLVACAAILTLAVPLLAADPDMLQDFCVADLEGSLRLNGFPCKRPEDMTADDFFSDVLAAPGNTSNLLGVAVMTADVEKVLGLNTLGVAMARGDYAPSAVYPPHTHPPASEVIFVVEGCLDASFITSYGKLFTRTVCKGELFVFPRGLLHFQQNNGGVPAVAITVFNSQLPGAQFPAAAMFGSSPPVPTEVLARALQIDGGMVEAMKPKFPLKYYV